VISERDAKISVCSAWFCSRGYGRFRPPDDAELFLHQRSPALLSVRSKIAWRSGEAASSAKYFPAAKLAYPNSRVIMLTGDGAFGFNAMVFDTAVRHKLNIVAILGNDSAWGIDRKIQLDSTAAP
jgi:hypothetical protein